MWLQLGKGMNKVLFWEQLIPEASSFKYLGIIIRNNLGRSCQLHPTKSMEGTSFHNAYTQKKGNNNTKRLAYTALVRPTLEYGAVCWDHTEKVR